MATQAINAYGTVIKMGAVGGPYTTVPDVTNLDGPSMERTMHDVTPHEEATIGWDQQIGGLRRGNQITGTQNRLPSRDDVSGGLGYAFANDEKKGFQLVWPETGAQWTFNGFVSGYVPHAPVDGPLTADFTITVTETVSFTTP